MTHAQYCTVHAYIIAQVKEFCANCQRFGFEDEYLDGRLTWWQQTKPRIWSMFDEPYSSSTAKVNHYSLSL
jgi:hypothetical protein